MSKAASIDPVTGKLTIDLAHLNEISDAQVKFADDLMVKMMSHRFADTQTVYDRLETEINALTGGGEQDLRDRMAAAGIAAQAPLVADESGYISGVMMERLGDMRDGMSAFYHEIAKISGSDEILTRMALDIQTLFHPDKPFVTDAPETPGM